LIGVGALLVADAPLGLRSWRKLRWTAWVPLLAAALLAMGVTFVCRDPAGGPGSIAGAAARYSAMANVGRNATAFAIHWVLAMAFGLPWAVLRWRTVLRRWWVLILGMVAAAYVLWASIGWGTAFMLAPVAGLGAAVLADVAIDAARRNDGIQLMLGTWLLLPLATAPYIHFASKYLVVAAPSAAILLAREMEAKGRRARVVLVGTLVLGLSLGVAMLRADAAFAGLGRTAARALIAPQIAVGRRVWYVGHWGFQWYADKAGARFFSIRRPYPAAGDLIVASAACIPNIKIREGGPLVHVARIESREPGGRLMDQTTGAGFYSNGWGYLPWAWGDSLLEAFDVWRVASSF
jgi:hypothetical protein